MSKNPKDAQNLIDKMLYDKRINPAEARVLRPSSPLFDNLSALISQPEIITLILSGLKQFAPTPPPPTKGEACYCYSGAGRHADTGGPVNLRPSLRTDHHADARVAGDIKLFERIGCTISMDPSTSDLFIVPIGLEDDASRHHDDRLAGLLSLVHYLSAYLDNQRVHFAVPQVSGKLVVLPVTMESLLDELWAEYEGDRSPTGTSNEALVQRAREAMRSAGDEGAEDD